MSPKAAKAEPPRARAIPEDDPAWQAFVNAPVVDEEYDADEERQQMEASQRSGRTYSQAEVEAMIAERRDREG